MNTLAHLYLSGIDPERLLGNFIGDSVRGSEFTNLPPGVQRGVLLHRQIDQFTDTHPVFRSLYKLLRPYFGRYAAVVGDVFLDHFLARDWTSHHPQELNEYIEWVHHTISPQIGQCPIRSQRYFEYLVQTQTLAAYRNIDGIAQTLGQMAKRARFASRMETGGAVLAEHYATIESSFEAFFPAIVEFAKSRVADEGGRATPTPH